MRAGEQLVRQHGDKKEKSPLYTEIVSGRGMRGNGKSAAQADSLCFGESHYAPTLRVLDETAKRSVSKPVHPLLLGPGIRANYEAAQKVKASIVAETQALHRRQRSILAH